MAREPFRGVPYVYVVYYYLSQLLQLSNIVFRQMCNDIIWYVCRLTFVFINSKFASLTSATQSKCAFVSKMHFFCTLQSHLMLQIKCFHKFCKFYNMQYKLVFHPDQSNMAVVVLYFRKTIKVICNNFFLQSIQDKFKNNKS